MESNAIDWSKARLKKISVRIEGHSTSISLEQCYLDILTGQAKRENISFSAFVTRVDKNRPPDINLSAALRLHAFLLARNQKP